ncbi:MAG: GTPase HflX [Chloroflexi bacterium RBG_16_48_8]|nr:MAG: GTPase HflX [Chloroflexi bacterium RBG_16_48_8]
MGKRPLPTRLPRERAFLVGVELASKQGYLTIEDSLAELTLLADTAGLSVVGRASQRLEHPDPKTFLRSGKVQEVKDLAGEVMADIILFDDELSPRHQRELEKIFGEDTRILDRSALILDIFAQHASTREGSLQVELAQYEYLLPRLTRAWTHLARQAGGGAGRAGLVGGVGLRGPGETQLEVDRRVIRQRISHIKGELEKVRKHRSQYRRRRRKAEMPTVALVGYTNAGKSTLLNHLTGSDVYVADQLFATLDPTTRRVALPGGHGVLMTDTVGFLQKLPATLVAAFRATLEEITEAELLLHVVDISHPNACAQGQVVRQTLEEIGVEDIPIVTALNKVDLLTDRKTVLDQLDDFERGVPISALTGEGVTTLLSVIEEEMYERLLPIEVKLPYREGGLISLFHEHGIVEEMQHTDSSVEMKGRIPLRLFADFKPFSTEKFSDSDMEEENHTS